MNKSFESEHQDAHQKLYSLYDCYADHSVPQKYYVNDLCSITTSNYSTNLEPWGLCKLHRGYFVEYKDKCNTVWWHGAAYKDPFTYKEKVFHHFNPAGVVPKVWFQKLMDCYNGKEFHD